jgi:hypothetical protein
MAAQLSQLSDTYISWLFVSLILTLNLRQIKYSLRSLVFGSHQSLFNIHDMLFIRPLHVTT